MRQDAQVNKKCMYVSMIPHFSMSDIYFFHDTILNLGSKFRNDFSYHCL